MRPCVALLHSFDEATGANADPEISLIPKLDAREVAAVFTARFEDFLRLNIEHDDDKHKHRGQGVDKDKHADPGQWYRGSWSLWHHSNWRSRFFNFFLFLGFPFSCTVHFPNPNLEVTQGGVYPCISSASASRRPGPSGIPFPFLIPLLLLPLPPPVGIRLEGNGQLWIMLPFLRIHYTTHGLRHGKGWAAVRRDPPGRLAFAPVSQKEDRRMSMATEKGICRALAGGGCRTDHAWGDRWILEFRIWDLGPWNRSGEGEAEQQEQEQAQERNQLTHCISAPFLCPGQRASGQASGWGSKSVTTTGGGGARSAGTEWASAAISRVRNDRANHRGRSASGVWA